MARHRDSKCRQCRREGEKLFLKGERCYTDKCAIERREYPPGQHGQGRRKSTEYATQLRAKQKIKRIYGIQETQFRKIFGNAERQKGITGENLILICESRLDNMMYRAGLAASRNEGRQLVVHGHVLVNGKRVDRPSYELSEGDVLSIRERSRQIKPIALALEAVERRGVPHWIELDKTAFSAKVKQLPGRADITMPMNEQLVVELYSK